MRAFLSICLILVSLAPATVLAQSDRLYEHWQFKTEEDLRGWDFAGFDKAQLTAEGVTFAVNEKATLYRDLPVGFHENVDALRIQYDATGLTEVKLLFLTLRESGGISQRFSLRFPVVAGGRAVQYIPLDYYRSQIGDAEVLAMVFLGTADSVTFDGVRFLHYSTWEKLLGMWHGFWSFERFEPFTINILHGPSVVFDGGPFMDEHGWRTLAQSANAYMLLGLILWGIALLFSRLALSRFRRISWEDARGKILSLFFTGVLLVWLFMDFRMGVEFIRNVARDHTQYVTAAPEKKVFRDVGDFYAFVAFAKPFLKNGGIYEVLLKDRWPYFGMIQYETYPARPNPNEPMSDLWVIYDRPDITVDAEGRLSHLGDPFTKPGRLLGRFSDDSFIHLASPLLQ